MDTSLLERSRASWLNVLRVLSLCKSDLHTFVRHGESEVNIKHVPFDPAAPLTELGRRQAEHIARRLAQLPIEALLASTMERAQETARFIASATSLPIEPSDEFTERRGPTSLIGMSVIGNAQVQEQDDRWIDSCVTDDLRVEDAENFSDLKARVERALGILEARTESHIAVVTHGFFLRMIVARILFGEGLTPREFKRFLTGLRTNNTGITLVQSVPKDIWSHWMDPSQKWIVRVWNDRAHLG